MHGGENGAPRRRADGREAPRGNSAIHGSRTAAVLAIVPGAIPYQDGLALLRPELGGRDNDPT